MKRSLLIVCTLLLSLSIFSVSSFALNKEESMPMYPFGVGQSASGDSPLWGGIILSNGELPHLVEFDYNSIQTGDEYDVSYTLYLGDMLRGQTFHIQVLFPLSVCSTGYMITPQSVSGVTVTQTGFYRFDLNNDNKGLFSIVRSDGVRYSVPSIYGDTFFPMVTFNFTITIDNTFTPPVGPHTDAIIFFNFSTVGQGTLPDYFSASVPVPKEPTDFLSSVSGFFSVFSWIFSVPEIQTILYIFVGCFGIAIFCKFVL